MENWNEHVKEIVEAHGKNFTEEDVYASFGLKDDAKERKNEVWGQVLASETSMSGMIMRIVEASEQPIEAALNCALIARNLVRIGAIKKSES